MQTTVKFDEEMAPNRLWIVAQAQEVERRNSHRDDDKPKQKSYKAHGCVCHSDGSPVIYTDKVTAQRAAVFLSKYMSNKLRVFKINGLKLQEMER